MGHVMWSTELLTGGVHVHKSHHFVQSLPVFVVSCVRERAPLSVLHHSHPVYA